MRKSGSFPEENNNVEETPKTIENNCGRFNVENVKLKPRKVSVVTFVDGERRTSVFNWVKIVFFKEKIWKHNTDSHKI